MREEVGVPDDKVIMTRIAVGYPSEAFPADTVAADVEPNSHFAKFTGVDG